MVSRDRDRCSLSLFGLFLVAGPRHEIEAAEVLRCMLCDIGCWGGKKGKDMSSSSPCARQHWKRTNGPPLDANNSISTKTKRRRWCQRRLSATRRGIDATPTRQRCRAVSTDTSQHAWNRERSREPRSNTILGGMAQVQGYLALPSPHLQAPNPSCRSSSRGHPSAHHPIGRNRANVTEQGLKRRCHSAPEIPHHNASALSCDSGIRSGPEDPMGQKRR